MPLTEDMHKSLTCVFNYSVIINGNVEAEVRALLKVPAFEATDAYDGSLMEFSKGGGPQNTLRVATATDQDEKVVFLKTMQLQLTAEHFIVTVIVCESRDERRITTEGEGPKATALREIAKKMFSDCSGTPIPSAVYAAPGVMAFSYELISRLNSSFRDGLKSVT